VGSRGIFPAAAVIGVAGALCWLGLRPQATGAQVQHEQVSPVQALSTLWRDRRFAWYSTGYFIFGFANIMISPVIPIFQVDVLQITPIWVAVLSTTSAALGGLLYYVWGRTIDRRGPFRTLLVAFTITAAMPVVYALAHSLPALLLAAVAAGIGGPGTELCWINAVMRFGRGGEVARYSALHMTLLGVRGLIAPWLGGGLIAVWPDLRPIFWLGFGLMGFAWAVMAAFIWRHARPGSDLGPTMKLRIAYGEHPRHE
jgi:MFS family permease